MRSGLLQALLMSWRHPLRRWIAGLGGAAPDRRPGVAPVDPPQARQDAARAQFAAQLRRGTPANEAVEALILASAHDIHVRRTARSLGAGLSADPARRIAGDLCLAALAAQDRLTDYAHQLFADVPKDIARRHAWPEFLATLAAADPAAFEQEAAALAGSDLGTLAGSQAVAAVKIMYGAGRRPEALAIAGRLLSAGSGRLAPAERRQLEWLDGYGAVAAEKRLLYAALPTHGPKLALVDRRQPDLARCAAFADDHFETLALLGCIARCESVACAGDAGLLSVLEAVRQRIPDPFRTRAPAGVLGLTAIDRDASSVAPPPRGTFIIVAGPLVAPTFRHLDCPFHAAIEPIFLSVACSDIDILTPAVIAYLKGRGPVGCRDRTTLALLRSLGVPAFFAGSLIATLGMLEVHAGNGIQPASIGQDAEVDLAGRFADNLHSALRALRALERQAEPVPTSRASLYLACRSLGKTADIRLGVASRRSLDGLVGLDAGAMAAMRDSLLARTDGLIAAIASGLDRDAVYAVWWSLCSADLEAADRDFHAGQGPPRRENAVKNLVAGVRRAAPHRGRPANGDPVDIVLASDANLSAYVPALLTSILRNTTGFVRFHLLTRSYPDAARDSLAALVADAHCELTCIACDGIEYGAVPGMLGHVTVSTLDRLLAPELLTDVVRAAYIDIDTVVLGDVRELVAVDLGGHMFAARSSLGWSFRTGWHHVLRAADRLPPERRDEFMRRMAERFDLSFAAFNAGVLVMDLARMRAEDAAGELVELVSRYGLNDQEALMCLVGPDRAKLPDRWNAYPFQERPSDPGLVHFLGPTKPWGEDDIPFKEVWARYQREASEKMRGQGRSPILLTSSLRGGRDEPSGSSGRG